MKCPHCGGDISGVLPSIGGQARAKALTKAKRAAIARKAAAARWKGHKKAKRRDVDGGQK
jgi:copper chaperone CopZ